MMVNDGWFPAGMIAFKNQLIRKVLVAVTMSLTFEKYFFEKICSQPVIRIGCNVVFLPHIHIGHAVSASDVLYGLVIQENFLPVLFLQKVEWKRIEEPGRFFYSL
jgi:hypothetical protein